MATPGKPTPHSTPLGISLLALALVAGVGCSPLEPFEIDQSLPRDPEPIPVTTGPGHWEREGISHLRGSGLRKFAVAGFRVEFVKKRRSPGGDEETTDYGRDTMEAICEQMFSDFMNHLSAFGIEIVPVATITRSEAYGRYPREEEPRVEPDQLGRNGLGESLEVELRTPRRLAFIPGVTSGDTQEVDLELLEELKADLVVHAHFVVGVSDGRATVESGSRIRMTGKEVRGLLTSVRSKLSQRSVLEGLAYETNEDGLYPVDRDRYELVMRFLFNDFLKFAFEDIY